MFGVLAALVLAAGAMLTMPSPGSAAGITGAPIAVTPVVPDNGIEKIACGPWNNWCQGPGCGPWNGWCGGGGGGGCGPWNNYCQGPSCGPWNNYCNGPYPGGSGACVTFGGLSFCTGVPGTNCKWYNGKKYCYGGGGGGDGWKDCTWYQGQKYCNYKKGGACIWKKGHKYCTGY
jgi:hypothetical protein